MKKALTNEQLEPLIFTIRGHRVVLDADLARLYGVNTKRFNEAFKRNRPRFPQLAATSSQAADSLWHNWSQFATSSSLHRSVSFRPWAFTEHGALMAANIPPKRRIGFHSDSD